MKKIHLGRVGAATEDMDIGPKAANPISESDRDGTFGARLTDDVFIEFADDFARGQFVEMRTLIDGFRYIGHMDWILQLFN